MVAIEEETTDFAALLLALYDRKFTGTIVLNFRGGKPLVAEIPSVQIRLDGRPKP